MLGWLGNIDPDDFYYSQQHTGGSNNYQHYSNPTVDKCLDTGHTAPDKATRKQAYDAAAKIIVDDASYIYLYNPDTVQGFSHKLTGYTVRGRQGDPLRRRVAVRLTADAALRRAQGRPGRGRSGRSQRHRLHADPPRTG